MHFCIPVTSRSTSGWFGNFWKGNNWLLQHKIGHFTKAMDISASASAKVIQRGKCQTEGKVSSSAYEL